MKLISISVLILILSFTIASGATTIGISPGTMTFSKVLKGGYAEQYVQVTTNFPRNLSGHVNIIGDVAAWIQIEGNYTLFNFSAKNPLIAKIIVTPPEDAKAGNYTATIEFVTDRITSVSGGAGSAVKASAATILKIEVVGEELIACTIGAYSIYSTEENEPIDFSATILNTGNARIRPKIELNVWDQLQKNLLLKYEFNAPEILPTTRREASAKIEQKLGLGQYWVDVTVPDCKSTELLTFSVVEKGTIADDGDLHGIFVRPFFYVGDIADITAVFANRGPRPVLAKFKGQLYQDNKLLQLLETDEVQVKPNQQEDFKIFYTPTKAGVYEIRGRVNYNNKLTYEKSATFTALKGPEQQYEFSFWPLLIYLLILLLIIILINKIREELKKKH